MHTLAAYISMLVQQLPDIQWNHVLKQCEVQNGYSYSALISEYSAPHQGHQIYSGTSHNTDM